MLTGNLYGPHLKSSSQIKPKKSAFTTLKKNVVNGLSHSDVRWYYISASQWMKFSWPSFVAMPGHRTKLIFCGAHTNWILRTIFRGLKYILSMVSKAGPGQSSSPASKAYFPQCYKWRWRGGKEMSALLTYDNSVSTDDINNILAGRDHSSCVMWDHTFPTALAEGGSGPS